MEAEPHFENTVRMETDPGRRTIEDLLTKKEIEQLVADTFSKESQALPVIRKISDEATLAHKIFEIRWKKQFKIPAIKYPPMSDESDRAYQIWDEQQAKILLKRYRPSLEDTVKIALPDQKLAEIMPTMEPKKESEIERLERLLAKVEARGSQEDVAYFTDKLRQAKERIEQVKTDIAESTTQSKRADLLEMMTVMGNNDAELVKKAYTIPEPEPIPEKVGLFGRFKKWLATDDSRPKPDTTQDFLNQPVPKPTLRPIANPAHRGIPINRENE